MFTLNGAMSYSYTVEKDGEKYTATAKATVSGYTITTYVFTIDSKEATTGELRISGVSVGTLTKN